MLQEQIERFFAAHGLKPSRRDEWVVTGGDFPAMRGEIHNHREAVNGHSVMLQIDVALGGDQVIQECFAGIGASKRDAIKNALENFSQNSLHVFLAALWDCAEPSQVSIEDWGIGDQSWKVAIGNFGIRSFHKRPVEIADGAFALIERLVRALDLNGEIFWVRTFFCNLNATDRVSEALLNNDMWKEAQDAIMSLPWAPSEDYYSVRNFMILRRIRAISDLTGSRRDSRIG